MSEIKFTRAFLEGGQSGYIVGLVLRSGRKLDLTFFPYGKGTQEIEEAYQKACVAQDSINKMNRWVGQAGFIRVKGVFHPVRVSK